MALRSKSEAIDRINAHDRPLAAYLFSDDQQSRDRFAQSVTSGALVINDITGWPAQVIVRGRAEGKKVITGLEVIAIQALEQFVLYTGVRPTEEQFAAAVAFARS